MESISPASCRRAARRCPRHQNPGLLQTRRYLAALSPQITLSSDPAFFELVAQVRA